ncbi:MAG: hypothetical protein CBD77_00220 [bacterium TMED217]|nr:MAG: hypothetical protein CBD77_00220 [bacterium TMED217]
MQNLSFFKGIRNLLYSNFFSLLFQFFFTFLLIKSLSLTELGKFSFSLSLLSIIIHILSFGIRQSITIQLKKNNGLISIIINNIIFHITCISAISFFGYLFINYFFIIAESDLYLLGLSFILLSIIFSQINGIYLGLNMYDNYTINNLSVHFSKIIILLVINHFIIITSKIALIILILSHIAFLIFSFINLSSYHSKNWEVDLRLYNKMIRSGFIYGANLFLIGLIYSGDIILLKFYVSDSDIGSYHIASKLISFICIIPQSIGMYFFSKNSLINIDKKNNSIISIIKYSIYFCIIIIISIIFSSGAIINALFDQSDFKIAITIIALSPGLIGLFLIKIIYPLLARNKPPVKYFIPFFISVLFNLALNVILIPYFSIFGAALASAITYSTLGLFIYYKFIYLIK